MDFLPNGRTAPPLPIRRLIADGNPVYLAVASAISHSADDATPTVESMNAVSIVTGELWCVVADTVLAGELRSKYPADSYVGKIFEIKKYKPQGGKRYARFSIIEISVKDPAKAMDIEATLARISAESNLQGENPAAFNRITRKDNPLALPYDEYLRTPLWRKIRRRRLQRDKGLCQRCGGSASLVHHRSYAEEVLLGNDDDQLASLCEGCHTIIHFDEAGQKRCEEETDRLLMHKDESANFPPPKVDLRRSRRTPSPVEWPRMTEIQRVAWHREYERQKVIRWGQSGKNSVAIRTILRGYGMDDPAIDAAVSQKPHKRKVHRQKQ